MRDEGWTRRQIAEHLGISESVVKKDISACSRAAGTRPADRAEAGREAIAAILRATRTCPIT